MADSDFQKEAFGQLNKIQLVFFTIIFVGFAADVSLDKSSLDLAREQLASIKDVTLKWNEDWLTIAASKKVQLAPDAGASQKFKFTLGPNNEQVLIELPPGEFQIRPLPPALDVLVQGHSERRFARRKPAISKPGSLSEFFSVWDALLEKIFIYTEFDPIDAATFMANRDRERFGKTLSKVSRVAPEDKPMQPMYHLVGNAFQIHPDDLEDLKKKEPTHIVIADWDLEGKRWFVEFFAKGRSKLTLDGQEALIAEYGRDWHLGPASYAFKDLHAISSNFADLPFDKIASILDSEAKRYGERLSLLGVSLPTGQLAVWSLLLTTIVYVYFLINLLGLARTAQDSGVIEYPWIGILPGKIPLCASLMTLCLFPVAFVVVKCLAIYQLANFSLATKLSLTAVALVLVTSTIVVGKTILMLRRKQVRISA